MSEKNRYMSAIEAGKKWGVGRRTVTVFCSQGRIPGAEFIGNAWVIPADAQKPADARVKSGKYIKEKTAPTDFAGLFQKLINSPELVSQIFDTFPTPIEIFAPDGTAVYINQALMKFLNQSDANATVGKFNVLNDPASDAIFGHETLVRMMSGEPVTVRDFAVPVQDQLDKGVSDDKPFVAGYMDVHSIPVWDGGRLAYVVCLFFIKQVYQGRTEMIKAQEYINENYREPFNRNKIAAAVNISPNHLSRIFREFSESSPQDYYREIKIEKIQKNLLDPSLTVAQAFAECGADSKGAFFRNFKKMTGMTPTEYRQQKEPPK